MIPLNTMEKEVFNPHLKDVIFWSFKKKYIYIYNERSNIAWNHTALLQSASTFFAQDEYFQLCAIDAKNAPPGMSGCEFASIGVFPLTLHVIPFEHTISYSGLLIPSVNVAFQSL